MKSTLQEMQQGSSYKPSESQVNIIQGFSIILFCQNPNITLGNADVAGTFIIIMLFY